MKTNYQLNKWACEMRECPTQYELMAIQALERHNMKFITQQVFGFYILDFIIPSKCLVVEIDGEYHNDNKLHDKIRDRFVKECGLLLLRIPNSEAKNIMWFINEYDDIDDYESIVKRAIMLAESKKIASDKVSRKKKKNNNNKDTWRF